MRLVVGEGLYLAAAGVGIGLVRRRRGNAFARPASSSGIEPKDPVTLRP